MQSSFDFYKKEKSLHLKIHEYGTLIHILQNLFRKMFKNYAQNITILK